MDKSSSVTILTQFAVAEPFLLHLAPEGPHPTQFGLLVVRVLSELLQPLLVGHFLLLPLLPLILQLQVAQTLLLQTRSVRYLLACHHDTLMGHRASTRLGQMDLANIILSM